MYIVKAIKYNIGYLTTYSLINSLTLFPFYLGIAIFTIFYKKEKK